MTSAPDALPPGSSDALNVPAARNPLKLVTVSVPTAPSAPLLQLSDVPVRTAIMVAPPLPPIW